MNTIAVKIFCSRQLKQIQEEGIFAILRKIKMLLLKLMKLFFVFMAVPIVLTIRILKPVVWIRFGYFLGSRIGHFAFDVEYYLVEKELGKQPKKAIDYFFYRWGKPANTFFARMCERQVRVRSWAEFLFTANHWLPGGHDHEVLPAMRRINSRDLKGLFQQAETKLYFTDEENMKGKTFLEKIGCKEGNKFVCLIVRDKAYLNTDLVHKRGIWDYHNFRDTSINTYEESALDLVEKGYWVFRMGKVIDKPFLANHQQIIDYANSNYKNDFLDIWLMANCFFCISTGTGLDEVARVFRRPAVYVNYLPTQLIVTYDHCITVPKNLVWQETKQRLTLSEHLAHSYQHSEKYEKARILVQDLTQEEILQAVEEMEARLNGSWKDSEEDNQLQNRFWEIFKAWPEYKKHHGRIHPKARVGSAFLKANTSWLN